MNYLEDSNPTLKGLITKAIYEALSNTHTNLIAKITKVNKTTIDCKPVIARVVDGQKVELPDFVEVPIINLLGGNSSIQMPIKEGDYCILFVIERCFDNWYYGADFEIPQSLRMHDYSDCLALVGVHNQNGELEIPDTIKISGDTLIDGDVVINGNLTINGELKVNKDAIIGGISFLNHTHSGVQGGSSSTSTPK